MRERFQVELAEVKRLALQRGVDLHRLGLDQNTGRINNGPMKLAITEPDQSNRSDES
jgi:hypothetical protein